MASESTKAAGEVQPLSITLTGPGQTPALGLRAVSHGFFIDGSTNVYRLSRSETVGWQTSTITLQGAVNPQHYVDYPNGHPGGYVVKLDANGNFLWQAEAVNPLDNINADGVAVDSSNNIYVVGDFGNFNYFNDSTANNGDQQSPNALTLNSPNITNLYVWKLNADGTNAWVSQVTSQAYNTAIWGLGISVDAQGAIYTTGSFNGAAVGFDPTVSHAGNPDIVTSPNFNFNTFVDKMDGGGHWLWTARPPAPATTGAPASPSTPPEIPTSPAT